MQPWKISVGLTAIICAVGLMLAGQGFSWIGPYFWIVLTDFWFPVSWYAGLALVTLMFSLYSGARLMGLADMGRKVDLMERSIRRGEGGQPSLPRNWNRKNEGSIREPSPRIELSNHKGETR